MRGSFMANGDPSCVFVRNTLLAKSPTLPFASSAAARLPRAGGLYAVAPISRRTRWFIRSTSQSSKKPLGLSGAGGMRRSPREAPRH